MNERSACNLRIKVNIIKGEYNSEEGQKGVLSGQKYMINGLLIECTGWVYVRTFDSSLRNSRAPGRKTNR